MKIEVSEKYKKYIADDLIDIFAQYYYRLDNPMPKADETEETYTHAYRNDKLLNAKVQSIVAKIMQTLDKYI